MVRLGIIGIGNIGSAHAHSVYDGHIPGMTLAALCDISPAVKEMAAREFPEAKFYADYQELLAQNEKVSSLLTREELDSCFTLDYYLKNVDYIFNRVF